MTYNKLYILLPCYNEEKNIKALTRDWLEELKLLPSELDYHIVIIDDGSSDHTKEILLELNKESCITAIIHTRNRGLGEALNTGIRYVLKQKDAKYLCIMDADQTHRPKYIHDMLAKMKRDALGCVIASRYQDNASVEGLSFNRILLSECAKYIYKAAFRVKGVRDYTCGYRLYDVKYLKKIKQRYGERVIKESSFACMAELLYKLACNGCTFGEVPFVLKYQLKDGTSKMNVLRTTRRSLATIIKLRWNRGTNDEEEMYSRNRSNELYDIVQYKGVWYR